tara:strand:+ start:560 stop:814 length:255 start_codon:yes stop_codon:yes gene_type:complete
MTCSTQSWEAPTTMAETFAILSSHGVLARDLATGLSRAVGFRNIAVHEYQEMDWAIVYRLCTEQLSVFRAFAAAITRAWPDPTE